jgi:hypothetical protein
MWMHYKRVRSFRGLFHVLAVAGAVVAGPILAFAGAVLSCFEFNILAHINQL